ncbi:MAG: peptidylprolyl isomerase [Pseudomonadota bacterium]
MPNHAPARRLRLALLGALVALLGLAPLAHADDSSPSQVRIETNLGSFTIELALARAPLTCAAFINNVRAGYYTGTVFHRVISNFVVQAGGYDDKFQSKTPSATVSNESGNGLSNKRGTVGLARGDSPHSGNAQFYVNLTDNDDLDPTPLRWGYTVFGKIIEGMDVVEKIGHSPTGSMGPWTRDAPLDMIVIQKAEIVGAAATAPATAH